jgi:3',5'-cyclic AMP phosphodiesterase CpdA
MTGSHTYPGRDLQHRVSRNPFGRISAGLAALALAAALLAGCRHQPARSSFQPFEFVQMCDPQIGFTEYASDLARFEQAVAQVNAMHPDLVVICGDLVNAANQKSFADFDAAKARFAVPCYVSPGNHDVGNKPTPESLEQYRRFEGKDYYSFEHKGCLFVVANSQLWKTPVEGETEKQDAWLAQTLQRAAKQQQRVFVVMHYPLFMKDPGEPDNYYNLPVEKRKELLALFRRCGVVAVLAGHTHTTAILEDQGIQMVTSANTSRNFDKGPYGFRIWHVGEQRPYRSELVRLEHQ